MLGQFPQSLKEDRRWVCFEAQKHPIDPGTGQNAKPNDPRNMGHAGSGAGRCLPLRSARRGGAAGTGALRH